MRVSSRAPPADLHCTGVGQLAEAFAPSVDCEHQEGITCLVRRRRRARGLARHELVRSSLVVAETGAASYVRVPIDCLPVERAPRAVDSANSVDYRVVAAELRVADPFVGRSRS